LEGTYLHEEERPIHMSKIKYLTSLMGSLEDMLPCVWLPEWESRVIDALRGQKSI
jgi:hypothetical protein